MARGFNTIGVFGDLNLGGGNVQANFNWIGDNSDAGMATANSVAYPAGSLVVHNDIVYIGLQASDNIEPGSANDSGHWEALGESNVIAQWGASNHYERGSVVYYRASNTAPALLYFALNEIAASQSGNMPPPMDATNWLPVGGTTINAQGALEYNENNGELTLNTSDDSLETFDDSGTTTLRVRTSDESLTASSGLSVNLRPDSEGSGNDIELDTSDSDNGLYVSSYDLEAQDHSGTLDTGVSAVDLNLEGGRDTDRDVTFQARILDAADSAGVTGISIDRPSGSSHILRVNAPPVASWAQTQDGTPADAETIIPMSKLPNIQLGNTHTFESITEDNNGDPVTPTANQTRDRVVANVGGQVVGTGRATTGIAWHPGDLLVISGTGADASSNGIFVYVGENQGNTPISPLRENGRNNGDSPTDAAGRTAAFMANFRAIISADTEAFPTVGTFTTDSGTVSSLGTLNAINYSATQDQLVLDGSAGDVTINQAERQPDDVMGVGGFINHIKIGTTIYRFGPTPPLPRLGLTPNLNPPEILLYRSSAQTIDYALTGTQDRRNDDGSVDRNHDISNTITGAVFAATDLTDVRGSGRTFATDTGVFTIPASTMPGFITTPGTVILTSSTAATQGLLGTPTSLTATEIDAIYSGPRSSTTGTRARRTSNTDYAPGTTIAWEMDSTTQYTVTVDGPDAERLQADLIREFNGAHASLYINTVGNGDQRIEVPGAGTFETAQGTEASNGMERRSQNELGTTDTGQGSGISGRVGTTFTDTLTDFTVTGFWTGPSDGSGTRTRAVAAGNPSTPYSNTLLSWSTPGNNSIVVFLTGDDAGRAQEDLQSLLDGTHDVIFLTETGLQQNIANDRTQGGIDEDVDARILYRAANEVAANENVQTDSSTTLRVTANANHIPDASIPSIIYDGTDPAVGIADAVSDPVIVWRDRRERPTVSNPAAFITVFDNSAITYNIDLNNGDSDIERGRGYDVLGWTVTEPGGTASAASTAATHPQAISSAIFGSADTASNPVTMNDIQFAFPMQPDGTRRNLQPNTPPTNASYTKTIGVRRPWGWFTGSSAPTATNIPTTLVNPNNEFGTSGLIISTQRGTHTLATNETFTGSPNDTIYLLAPMIDVGVTTGNIGDSGRLQLFNPGTLGTSSATLISILNVATSQSGTTVPYAVFRTAAVLVGTSITLNVQAITT